MAGKPLDEQIEQAQTASTEVVRQPVHHPVQVELEKAAVAIGKALPASFPGGSERFARTVMTAVRLNPELSKCTPRSVVGAAIQAAQLGLTPGMLGEAWLIPFRNRDTGHLEAQFILGWKGLVALAARAGYVVRGHVVYEHDDFDYELGLELKLRHKPTLAADKGRAVLWYAVVTKADTGTLYGFAVIDRAHVERRRKASKSPNSPAWRDWFDEMALGKAAREALRMVPLTVEAQIALLADETVRSDYAGQPDDYVLGDDLDTIAEPEGDA